MQRINRLLLLLILPALVSLYSCKKEASSNDEVDQVTEITTHSDDQSRVSADMDAISDDANNSIEDFPMLAGKDAQSQGQICGATTVFDSANKKLTITYNGNNCQNNRFRQGTVVVTLSGAKKWKDSGAVITVNFQNLKITRLSDNKSIVINGTQTVTNASGGRIFWVKIPGTNYPTVTHIINASNMSITFDDGTQRTWQVAKKREFKNDGGLVVRTTGLHTIGTNNKVSEWGTNRYGHDFVTSITEPMTIRESCNFRLTSGQVKHEVLSRTVTTTFGLDSTGVATLCPGNAPFYMKVVWTNANGVSVTHIKPY